MSESIPFVELWDFEGWEEIKDVVAARPTHHFHVIHSIHLLHRQKDFFGDPWSNLILIMAEPEAPFARVGFKFHRIGDLKIERFGWITGLSFIRIPEQRPHHEQFRYEVEDYEEDHIHLLCHDISVFIPTAEKPLGDVCLS